MRIMKGGGYLVGLAPTGVPPTVATRIWFLLLSAGLLLSPPPPSSGGEVGTYYTRMIAQVREALASLETEFPAARGRGHELAGFVWYHGWNDGVEPKTGAGVSPGNHQCGFKTLGLTLVR